MEKHKAIEEATTFMFQWHLRQPEFKDVAVNPSDKFVRASARLLEDATTWRVEIAHLHFPVTGVGPQQSWLFSCDVKEKPENPRCVKGPNST